jgi:hypothetical protein
VRFGGDCPKQRKNKTLCTTGKLGGCYFSLVLFSKSALRLILKIKAALFENNRLISPSFLRYFHFFNNQQYEKNLCSVPLWLAVEPSLGAKQRFGQLVYLFWQPKNKQEMECLERSPISKL